MIVPHIFEKKKKKDGAVLRFSFLQIFIQYRQAQKLNRIA